MKIAGLLAVCSAAGADVVPAASSILFVFAIPFRAVLRLPEQGRNCYRLRQQNA
jgi:hypothetical protein